MEVAEPELHGFGGSIEVAAEEGGVLDEDESWLMFTLQVISCFPVVQSGMPPGTLLDGRSLGIYWLPGK